MDTVSRIRGRAAAPVLLLALASAGCAAGASAVQLHEHAAIQGTDVQVGQIKLLDVYLEPSPGVPANASAVLAARLIDVGSAPDTLTGVSIPNSQVSLSSTSGSAPGGGVTIEPDSLGVAFADPHTGQTGLLLAVTGGQLQNGTSVPVTFTFATAGSATFQIPVYLADAASSPPPSIAPTFGSASP